MAPCDLYLFGELNLAMKGKRYADVDAIQRAFDNLLDRANCCIQCEGDYFEGD